MIGLALRGLGRDWRSGELGVLVAAVVVAVAAITAVGLFTDRVSRAVVRQAAEVLAADLTLGASSELPSRYADMAREAGLASARKLEFPSVVIRGDASALAEIRAVTPGYPLRGQVRIALARGAGERVADTIPAVGEAWADPGLLARLDAAVGDVVDVGEHRLRIAAVLVFAPDQGFRFTDLAPSLLVNLDDIPAMDLLGPGSRVSHTLLFAGPEAAVAALRTRLADEISPGEKLRDVSDVTPELKRAVGRADRFLGLSALVSVLLAAVAVGMAARRYAARHLDAAALMKCMGASQRTVLGISLVQLTALGVVAGVLGGLLGLVAQYGLSLALADVAGGQLPAPSARPMIAGLWTALVLMTGFALPPVMALATVAPLRVLKRDTPAAAPGPALTYLAAAGAIVAMLFWMVRDTTLVVQVLIGAALALATLWGCGWLLVLAAARVRGGAGAAWRFGLANIGRRGGDSVVQVVAFGLGLMVLLLLTLVRNDLLDAWAATLDNDVPNHFLINIQPSERDLVRRFFAERGLEPPVLMPLVRGRMTHINRVPVAQIDFASDRGARFAQREGNLTWAGDLRDDNAVVAGRWWTEAVPGQVSVEQDYARRLGLSLGDVVTHDIAGESVDATVTSIRTVAWDSFRPNFFLVFSPGTLDVYAHTWVGSTHLSSDRDDALLDLVRELPSVTTIDIAAILAQVRGVMDKAALAVQYVFGFTLLAGVMVLLAAVQSSREERAFESALLRTLGASRRVILMGVATEFTTLGLLAGLLASATASAAGYLLATRVFELDYSPGLWLWMAGLLAGAVVVGGSGLVATHRVVNQPPVLSLRG